jgi:hypothetical protein
MIFRSGRRRVFEPAAVAEVKALACQLPAETGVPLSRWSVAELATEATHGDRGGSVASTVRRWLDADAIKPWQTPVLDLPPRSDFAFEAGRVLDIYGRVWDGEPLGGDESSSARTRSLNSKPCTAAPGDCHQDRAGPDAFEFEYRRGGTLAYLAAYDVHTRASDRKVRAHHGIVPFTALVVQVHDARTLRVGPPVFWITDNGSPTTERQQDNA